MNRPFQFGLASLFALTLGVAVFVWIGREAWSHPLFALVCRLLMWLAFVAGGALAVRCAVQRVVVRRRSGTTETENET
jgi:hypothetical protein